MFEKYSSTIKTIFAIFVLFILFFSVLIVFNIKAHDYIIEGNTVYVENSKGKISIYPHTLQQDGYVYVNLTSYDFDGTVECGFLFEHEKITPKKPEIWRNYSHDVIVWENIERYRNTSLLNITSYQNLGIQNYENYNVDWGTKNNTRLFRIMSNNVSRIYAFTTYAIVENVTTFYGNHSRLEQHLEQEYFFDWKKFDKEIEKSNISFNGFTKKFSIETNITTNNEYYARFFLDFEFNSKGIYWFFLKKPNWDLSDERCIFLNPWWDGDWKNFRKIIIESDYISTTIKNFPVLVVLDNSTGDFCFHNSGSDIRFLSTDNTTEFFYEIEEFDNSGSTYCWVNISENILFDTDFELLIYYNNSNAIDNQNPPNVWDSGFISVYHGRTTTDSKWNYNLTNYGTSLDETGIVSGCFDFEYDDSDYMQNTMYYDVSSNTQYTMEAWFSLESVGGSPPNAYSFSGIIVGDGDSNDTLDGLELRTRANPTQSFQAYFHNSASVYIYRNGVTAITLSTFHYSLATYDSVSDTIQLYREGILTGGATGTSGNPDISTFGKDRIVLGWNQPLSWYDGMMDEIRISKGIRNETYVNATYNMIQNQDLFITIGDEFVITITPEYNIQLNYPLNNSENINLQPTVVLNISGIIIYDIDVNLYYFYNGIWCELGETKIISSNSTIYEEMFISYNYSTSYTWRVTATDGVTEYNETYVFTTVSSSNGLSFSSFSFSEETLVLFWCIFSFSLFFYYILNDKRSKTFAYIFSFLFLANVFMMFGYIALNYASMQHAEDIIYVTLLILNIIIFLTCIFEVKE